MFLAVRSPGTTLTISRLSASIATWSQVSPLRSSAGLVSWQFFSFLATKDHLSSNWTSRVWRGKLDQFVVEVSGVFPSNSAQAANRVAVHLAEPSRLADTAPFSDMFQDRFDLLRRQSGVEQGCPFSLRESGLTSAASEHASGVGRAVKLVIVRFPLPR